jgi:hypothetical protein
MRLNFRLIAYVEEEYAFLLQIEHVADHMEAIPAVHEGVRRESRVE